MKRYWLYDGYCTPTPVKKFWTHRGAVRYVERMGAKLGGITRNWIVNDVNYFDCGAVVYRLVKKKQY